MVVVPVCDKLSQLDKSYPHLPLGQQLQQVFLSGPNGSFASESTFKMNGQWLVFDFKALGNKLLIDFLVCQKPVGARL
ncbi:MAG: hypothetical protein ACF8OB_06555 [Phycisphaeraceae bacterium JB051]